MSLKLDNLKILTLIDLSSKKSTNHKNFKAGTNGYQQGRVLIQQVHPMLLGEDLLKQKVQPRYDGRRSK